MDENALLKNFLENNIGLIGAAAHAYGYTNVEEEARNISRDLTKFTVSYKGEKSSNLAKNQAAKKIIGYIKKIIEEKEGTVTKEKIEKELKEKGFNNKNLFRKESDIEENKKKNKTYRSLTFDDFKVEDEEGNKYVLSSHWGSKNMGIDFDELCEAVDKLNYGIEVYGDNEILDDNKE